MLCSRSLILSGTSEKRGLTRGQVWRADVELDLTIDQGEMVMSIYTLMDCKWLAGIMTKWKKSASHPWALFTTWVMEKQLFWTNRPYPSKCRMQSSPIFSFFKWSLAVLPFVSIVIEWELHHYLNELVLFLYWMTLWSLGIFELTPLHKHLWVLQSSSFWLKVGLLQSVSADLNL